MGRGEGLTRLLVGIIGSSHVDLVLLFLQVVNRVIIFPWYLKACKQRCTDNHHYNWFAEWVQLWKSMHFFTPPTFPIFVLLGHIYHIVSSLCLGICKEILKKQQQIYTTVRVYFKNWFNWSLHGLSTSIVWLSAQIFPCQFAYFRLDEL